MPAFGRGATPGISPRAAAPACFGNPRTRKGFPMSDTVSQVLDEIVAGDALGVGAAARLLPAHRGTGRVNPATVWRWMRTGTRTADGRVIYLEAARVGQRWLTSASALKRFISALTPAPAGSQPPAEPARTPASGRKASELAAKKLKALGA